MTLYYQTTTREYAEFLRDAVPDGGGADVWARWQAHGRSAPVAMRRVEADVTPACRPTDGPCCGVAAGIPCDDGDVCTVDDACDGTRCAGTVQSVVGLGCELERLVHPDLCEAPLPRKLRRLVAQRVRRARALVRGASRSSKPEKTRLLLGRAANALGPITARAQAAVTGGPGRQRIPAACADAIGTAVARAVEGAARLHPAARAARRTSARRHQA